MIEPLDPRILLAVSVSLDSGVLVVRGSAGHDAIGVMDVEGQLKVTINTAIFMAPWTDARQIRILAGAGNDRVTVDPTVGIGAEIRGGIGHDVLVGGRRAARLYGEGGNDTLVGGLSRDVFSGGSGIDTADFSARTDALTISLDGRANDGAGVRERDNVMADVENVIGGDSNDLITGSASRNILKGGAGNDTLIGEGGDDVLMGGAGADLLQGADGDDALFGIDYFGRDTLDGGNGFDAASMDNGRRGRDTILDIEMDLILQ